MYNKHILTQSSYKKKNHIIEKVNNNYVVKHPYGTMIFDIKRYKYKFKNEIQIFIYQVFKVMSLQKRLKNYVVKTCLQCNGSLMSRFTNNN